MPNCKQSDIDYSYELVEYLGIKSMVLNIHDTLDTLYGDLALVLPDG